MNWAYTSVMLTAVATGVVLSRRYQPALKLAPLERLAIGVGAFCGAMLGAKLPFVLADWSGLLSGGAWFADGKTIVAGLVGGYFGVEAAKWSLGVRTKTGDSFAVPVAAAVAIGRLACFVAGCCHGTETNLPWGIDFGDGIRRHPTQLYEFVFHAGAALVLAWMYRRRVCRGQLIKLYIIAYLTFRFCTEWIRPEPEVWLGLTGYQWGALVLIPVFAWLWRRDARALAGAAAGYRPRAAG